MRLDSMLPADAESDANEEVTGPESPPVLPEAAAIGDCEGIRARAAKRASKSDKPAARSASSEKSDEEVLEALRVESDHKECVPECAPAEAHEFDP
jgi:hypothetical protein